LIPEISPALKARDYKGPSSDGAGDGMPLIPEIASEKARSMGEREEQTPTLRAGGEISMARGMEVRRLTPLECSRLQGFPDNYLDVLHNGKPMADGPRYKALGNSMAVPVIRWLGERIALASRLV
jgi:DNA (cytosine-5)-methyltransferase 1